MMFVALSVIVLALVIYEGVALSNHRPGDTISEVVWAACAKRPLWPFVAGLVAGHFFWQS
jgi:hypothetical protein